MGDAQSAQREDGRDAAEQESGQVEDAQTEPCEAKPHKNAGQLSEINTKAASRLAEVNGHRENETAAEASEMSLKEAKKTIENVNIIEKESPHEADVYPDEEISLEMSELEENQNDVNESFKNIFSNIGLKFTLKRGSRKKPEPATDALVETHTETQSIPGDDDDHHDATMKPKSEDAEQNTDLNTAQESNDNDSTTCPTLTDEDVLENTEKKTKERVADTTVGEDEHQAGSQEKESDPTSPSSSEQEEVVSPIKRFFKTGIFSNLRKRKKAADDETTENELVNLGKEEAKTEQNQQQEKEVSNQGIAEERGKKDIQEKTLSGGLSNGGLEEKISPDFVSKPEIMSSQEKVQASPLKRFLSGSNLKKLPKKQKERKSSDANLSDSGEYFPDQLSTPAELTKQQKEDVLAQPLVEGAEEEDGAWASFKKLMTPKKRLKKNEETQSPVSSEEQKLSEGEQISDHSTEEKRKRKDSSVSWEAVLCGSGRRRSQKTSDSEDETPQTEKRVDESTHRVESPIKGFETDEIAASSPKQTRSLSENDGVSTWQSFKRLVTPKRKARDEEESKYMLSSNTEVTQEESLCSMKKLLPGRKKRKSAEGQLSSDEADRDVDSDDDDESETPAVIPLSEFDTVEVEAVIQTETEVESHLLRETDEVEPDILNQISKPTLQPEAQTDQEKDDALENKASPVSATNAELENFTEIISKHQQLSDIPEEGLITETMATPASVFEEAMRDDTIAEDLIEITSEAFTAPEPVDITQSDETEMISAVSQLSESSKTSGNTTPVPAEYDLKETELLLQEVVETISVEPNAIPVCLEELNLERIVDSVSHLILGTFVEEQQPKILEKHTESDATAIKIGLKVEELDALNKLAATAQKETLSEVKEATSTELVSEIPAEEFATAKSAVDEVHEVTVSQQEDRIKGLGSANESQHLVEAEVNEEVLAELLPEDKGINPDEVSIHQTEAELPKMDMEDIASAVTAETDGALEQEIQSLIETIDKNVEDHPPIVVEKILTALKEGSLQSEETEGMLTDIPADETVKVEPEEEASEDVPETEKCTDELFTEHFSGTILDLECKDIAHHQGALILEAATSDSEEVLVQPVEVSVPEAEIVGTLEEVTAPLTEDHVEQQSEDEKEADASKTELIAEPAVVEAARAPQSESEERDLESLKKEEISKVVPAEEIDMSKETVKADSESEEEQAEEAKPEIVQQPELFRCDVKDNVTETETDVATSAHVVPECVEESKVQDLAKVLKEIPTAETQHVTATEELTSQRDGGLETQEKRKKIESTADVQDVQAEEEYCTPQFVEAVHVICINDETSCAQILEKAIISEDAAAPCVDMASVTDEPKHEVHCSEMEVTPDREKESELPAAEMRTVSLEHGKPAQVTTCNLKEVSPTITELLIEKPTDMHVPLIDTVVGELELRETAEMATPLMIDDFSETAQEGSVVLTLHAPTVEFDDNHSVQVQVVNVDIESAETTVDTVLQASVAEASEVIDVSQETLKKVDNLLATPGVEDEYFEENRVTVQEVIQHVTVPEISPVNVEEDVKEATSAEGRQSEGLEKRTGTLTEQPDEVISNTSAIETEQEVTEEVMQTLDVTDVSVEDGKEDLEETKLEKAEVCVQTEDTICSSEKLAVKEDTAEAPQLVQKKTGTPDNTEVAVPENTGIISSTGTVEPPSSLSLEFKLNIQFGQMKTLASPSSPTTATTERPEIKEMPEVRVHTVETVQPVRQVNPVECPKQTPEAAVKETIEVAAKSASAAILTPAALLDTGIQAMETVEVVEDLKSTESVILNVLPVETTQSEKKKQVPLSQQFPSEAREQKTAEPVKKTEEDQDVWMDAEENIYTQEITEVSQHEESLECETDQEEKVALEKQFQPAPNYNTEAEEHQEMHQTSGTCDIDSEEENFAIAFEQQDTAMGSIKVVEWD